MKVTKHAKQRLKERNGLNKNACNRMAQKALENGIKHSETKGNLNKWINKLFLTTKKANNIRLYGDKAYLFSGETLITVLQIPSNLTKDLKNMTKK